MGKMKNISTILVRWKRVPTRNRRILKDNNKMGLRERGRDDVELSQLAQNGDQW
jgi:hypothetical protein